MVKGCIFVASNIALGCNFLEINGYFINHQHQIALTLWGLFAFSVIYLNPFSNERGFVVLSKKLVICQLLVLHYICKQKNILYELERKR